MGIDVIGVHLRSDDPRQVRQAISALLTSEGFRLIADAPLQAVLAEEVRLPEGDDWYGVIVSGTAGDRWVSVYVADWPDSGLLARRLSAQLATSALEVWVVQSAHWGYTYYESGEVVDRFTDDPARVAETETEAALYQGRADALKSVLHLPVLDFDLLLAQARADSGQFCAGAVDALAQAVGLPFEHAFTGYEDFLDNDPEESADALEDWPQFHLLVFTLPPGREGLTE